jgi:glycosyltransferase involved in cell wall biosynthesis
MKTGPRLVIFSCYNIGCCPQIGSGQRILATAQYLSREFEVHLIYLCGQNTGSKEDACFTAVHYLYPTRRSLAVKIWNLLIRLKNKLMRQQYFYDRCLRQMFPGSTAAIENILEEIQPDVALFEYLWSYFPGLEWVKKRKIPVYVDTHDILYKRYATAKKLGHTHNVPRVSEKHEIRLLRKADTILAIQSEEAEDFRGMLGVEADVLTVMHSFGDAKEVKSREMNSAQVLFVGSASNHNVHALRCFLENHWPKVKEAVPEATLQICGSVCKFVDDTKLPGVVFNGRVDDLAGWYSGSQVVLNIPLFGSGLKIKAVEAMQYGACILMTPAGAQGLKSEAKAYVLSEPEKLADTLTEMLLDPLRCLKMQDEAVETYKRSFSPEAIYGPLASHMHRALTKDVAK